MNYYRIETSDWIENKCFPTLKDAKHHIYVGFTSDECKRLFHPSRNPGIYHFKGDDCVSVTPIEVDDKGYVTYKKTKKC